MKTQEIIDIEDKYFINTFNRVPIVLDHGEGVKVWDIEGNEYLDFLAGIAVNCLGHNHPKLVKAIQDQAEKLQPFMPKDWWMQQALTGFSLQTQGLKQTREQSSLR